MTPMPSALRSLIAVIVVLLAGPSARAGDESRGWKPNEAGKYLDEREKVWFEDASCVSCHTVLPYALARTALRQFAGTETRPEEETKLLAQIRLRVANWKKLDSEEFGLYYHDSDQKKKESWGTEAVFNSVILAFDDRYQGRSSPSADTKQAFSHLWETQVQAGDNKGTWVWLHFNEPPWGSTESPYFGAALAAIAVGTAPGYYTPGADADIDVRVKLLQSHLKGEFQRQNLHNQAWGLWAATKIEGILPQAERKKLIDRLLDKQLPDGGWSLLSLGPWSRGGGTAQETTSDGYATGLVLHVLQTAGVPKDEVKVAKGLHWLKQNQAATGAWSTVSLIKKRDPASHVGKFMSDAATAFAVLALSH
jgi:squalene-hopene/tetraprenyl-beta-curcumene cyclase